MKTNTRNAGLALLLGLACPAGAADPPGVVVLGASGLVQSRAAADVPWRAVEKTPAPAAVGTSLRSGRQSSAFLRVGPDSTALLQEDTVLTLEDAAPGRLLVRVDIGVAVFHVARDPARRVQVRTPSAALSARGGEFRVTVLSGGRTTVELSEGELGVEDNRGHELLLRAGESVRVDLRGLEIPQRLPAVADLRRESLRERIRRETAADSFRERLLDAASEARRRDEWEAGRALVDPGGNRVRVETYVRRPRADQLEFVVLNSRADQRDYFYHLGTYDAPLPDDPSDALRALAGTAGAAPPRTLLAYESARSNGPDVVLETADGGHLVDLNANADGNDDVSGVFDPETGVIIPAAGTAAWRSLFDRYGLYVNGRLAAGWTGANIQVSADKVRTTANDPFSGAALSAANALMDAGALAARTTAVANPAAGLARQLVVDSWSDGSSLTAYSAGLSAGGETAGAGLPGAGGAQAFRAALSGHGLEQSLSSTLFGGRSIRLRLDPALGVPAGLVP